VPLSPREWWKLNRSGPHGSGNGREWCLLSRRPTLPHKPREGWGDPVGDIEIKSLGHLQRTRKDGAPSATHPNLKS